MAEIYSEAYNDKIVGTDEGDTIYSAGIVSSIVGAGGDDVIISEGYLSTVEGGDGNDRISLNRSYISAYGGDGNDVLIIDTGVLYENIANVSLTGGAGEDIFTFAVDYDLYTAEGYDPYYDWKRIYSSTITDFNAGESDRIVLGNIGSDNNLFYERSIDLISFTLKDVTHFDDIAVANVIFSDGDPEAPAQSFEEVVPFDWIRADVKTLNDYLIVSSTEDGDIQLSDGAFLNIDAVEDSVSGRALIGNDYDNRIYASDFGSKLWGKGGNDYLIGGNGADTFYAGRDEGITDIYHCADNDIVKLWNVNVEDLSGLELDKFEGYGDAHILAREDLIIGTHDGSTITIHRPNDATTFTVQLADGLTFRYDWDEGSWDFAERELIEPLTASTLPDGLMKLFNTAYVSSEYDGAVRLAEYNDSVMTDINAQNDTVSGRVLAGDAQNNFIYANNYGSSLWGGTGGDDILLGGAGDDTFVAGQGEGNTAIWNYTTNDTVILKNINFSNLQFLNIRIEDRNTGFACVTTDDGTYIEVQLTTTTTTMQLADGSAIRYNASEDGSWQRRNSSGGSWQALTSVNGMPVGLTRVNELVYVYSDYDGVFSLEDFGDSTVTRISAFYDTENNRVLIGDAQNNRIRASNLYGSDMWGGTGGDDTLVGGDGPDGFVVGTNEGTTTVINASEDDAVVLWNVNSSDVTDYIATIGANDEVVLGVTTGEGVATVSMVWESETSMAETTTFLFADDEQRQFNHLTGTWSSSDDNLTSLLNIDLNEMMADFSSTALDSDSPLDAWSKIDMMKKSLQLAGNAK